MKGNTMGEARRRREKEEQLAQTKAFGFPIKNDNFDFLTFPSRIHKRDVEKHYNEAIRRGTVLRLEGSVRKAEFWFNYAEKLRPRF